MIDGKESAERLKARSRKTITLPESQVPFEIRKLIPRDFVSCIEVVRQLDIPQRSVLDGPDESDAAKSARQKRINETIAASREYQRASLGVIIGRGIISPKVLLEDDEVAGDGEVNAFDIPPGDFKYLIEQIIEFSGLGTEAQAVEFFLGQAAANDGASRSDGGAVRETPA